MTVFAAAATAHHHISHWLLALAVLILLAAWLGSLLIWPYGNCGRCRGSGKSWGSNRRRHGICRRCGGSGRRRRRFAGLVHRASSRRRQP